MTQVNPPVLNAACPVKADETVALLVVLGTGFAENLEKHTHGFKVLVLAQVRECVRTRICIIHIARAGHLCYKTACRNSAVRTILHIFEIANLHGLAKILTNQGGGEINTHTVAPKPYCHNQHIPHGSSMRNTNNNFTIFAYTYMHRLPLSG